MLEADPQYRRVPPGDIGRLVAAALADGAALAAGMEGSDPRALCAARGIEIVEADAADFGTTLVFAEWRPGRITLYREPLGRLSRIAGVDAAPIYVAHELYHQLDAARRVPLARRYPVRILGLWTSGLAALPEIAAGAFAERLLSLPCHPRWLELQLADGGRNLARADSAICRRTHRSVRKHGGISAPPRCGGCPRGSRRRWHGR